MNLRNGHLLVMLLFCVGFFALAEEPGTSPDFVGGTCVVVAWRGDMFGVAADARETVFGSGEIDNVCKMRSPARGVLLTVTGVEEIRGGGKVAWSGLDEATSIFSAIGPGTSLTDEQLMRNANQWEDKFQKFLVAGHYRPPAMIDREDFMTLQVFYRVFGEPRVLISRFKLVAGKIRRNDPFFASAPASNRTKTIPFGDCAGYLGIDADRQELTASEVKSYKVLADKQKPASTTAVSLTKLALDYVRLAVRVSARTATKQKPARIAPPFTTATLRDGAAHWTFAPSQVCAPYLSLGRSK